MAVGDITRHTATAPVRAITVGRPTRRPMSGEGRQAGTAGRRIESLQHANTDGPRSPTYTQSQINTRAHPHGEQRAPEFQTQTLWNTQSGRTYACLSHISKPKATPWPNSPRRSEEKRHRTGQDSPARTPANSAPPTRSSSVTRTTLGTSGAFRAGLASLCQ